MRKLENEQEFESLKQGNTVFMFTAGWCPDCRVIEPGLPSLEEKHSAYTFVSVNRDAFIDICVDNGIMGIPSFIVYSNGQELGRYVGKERKSIEQIDTFLQNL